MPVNPAGAAANSLAAQPLTTDTAVPTSVPTDAPPATFTPTPNPSPTVVPPTAAPTQVPAATVTPTPVWPDSAFPDWKGEYFENDSLSGLPVRVINDGVGQKPNELKLNWGDGAPAEFVPADSFSVRWTRTINIDQRAAYHFSLKVDDGARVYVDGNLVIDKWRDASAAKTYSQDVHLTAGSHAVRVEMLEQGGQAFLEFSYVKVETYTGWKGEYFAGRDLGGAPTVRNDDVIHFDWGIGSPAGGIPADGFSVRWTRTIDFEQDGEYVFKVDADDGVRLSVDGMRLIDEWHDASQKTHEGRINLAAGWHTVVLEYYENTGNAYVQFVYEPPISGWKGEYFGNPDLSGMPVFIRDDGSTNGFNFGWGYDSPGPGILIDNFSARWTRTLDIKDAGRYRFSITADDGARFFIDNHLVLDEWHRSNSETYSFMADLPAGPHEFRIEYYEQDGRARIVFEDWTRVSDIPTTQPPSTPSPT
ncbi:MAG: PA14 domain-containing protein, partial [Vicinamibacterales bacterium]